jgi:hypothetical protein
MVPDDTSCNRAQHSMMPRDMPDHAAHGGALQTALRATDPRQHGDQRGGCNAQL